MRRGQGSGFFTQDPGGAISARPRCRALSHHAQQCAGAVNRSPSVFALLAVTHQQPYRGDQLVDRFAVNFAQKVELGSARIFGTKGHDDELLGSVGDRVGDDPHDFRFAFVQLLGEVNALRGE